MSANRHLLGTHTEEKHSMHTLEKNALMQGSLTPKRILFFIFLFRLYRRPRQYMVDGNTRGTLLPPLAFDIVE